jgi:predicted membrane channel-forming protein YqfA (hemolysin III family)
MRKQCSDPTGLFTALVAGILLSLGGVQLFLAAAYRAVPSSRFLKVSVWVLAGWSAVACLLIMAGGLAFLGSPFNNFSFADTLWFLAFTALPLVVALAFHKWNGA